MSTKAGEKLVLVGYVLKKIVVEILLLKFFCWKMFGGKYLVGIFAIVDILEPPTFKEI